VIIVVVFCIFLLLLLVRTEPLDVALDFALFAGLLAIAVLRQVVILIIVHIVLLTAGLSFAIQCTTSTALIAFVLLL
jgi:hypothetical protein